MHPHKVSYRGPHQSLREPWDLAEWQSAQFQGTTFRFNHRAPLATCSATKASSSDEEVCVHCCLQAESPLLWVLTLEEAQPTPQEAPPLLSTSVHLAHPLRKAPVGSPGPPSEAGHADNKQTDLFLQSSG